MVTPELTTIWLAIAATAVVTRCSVMAQDNRAQTVKEMALPKDIGIVGIAKGQG